MILTVCKNIIASNNKRKWQDPQPAIRIADSNGTCAIDRANRIGIVDAHGNIVAEMISTTDGNPIVSCGAKVALVTDFDVVVLD